MRILIAALCGFVLDLVLGDPVSAAAFHPVVWMGRAVTFLERWLRNRFPKSARGEYTAGLIMAVLLPAGTLMLSAGVLCLLRAFFPPLAFLLEAVWCWQALAVKDLRVEAMRVYEPLSRGDLFSAREAVSRIVGRDTDVLDEAGVARAAVETVAENFSDGIVAPLLYMLAGGAPLALCYKAVNTMDSMVGYKNERYLYFGRPAAKLDDAVNFLPSRLAALLLIAAACICGQNAGAAVKIWQRDRRKHASPNAAQCESVMAGALGLRLCGPASYFGKPADKPYIGDAEREIVPEDIPHACQMEGAGSMLCLLLLCLMRLIWVII